MPRSLRGFFEIAGAVDWLRDEPGEAFEAADLAGSVDSRRLPPMARWRCGRSAVWRDEWPAVGQTV
eukprot:8495428-Alexandrium_andersonii.AAC.1